MIWKDFDSHVWEQKSLVLKVLTVAGFILSVVIIVLAFLQIFDIWGQAINIFEPLLGVLMVIQAINNWKINRILSYFSIAVAVVVFSAAALILL